MVLHINFVQAKRIGASVSLLALAASLAACGGGTPTATSSPDAGAASSTAPAADSPFTENVAITGAGATFPAPLYQRWFQDLNGKIPQLQVNYQSVGSGAGIEQYTKGTVDFGASDTAMKDDAIAKVPADRGVHMLPMTAGSIVYAYNLDGVETGLKLTREAYIGITMGEITKWNDPKIVAANPGVTLPDLAITFVHRSDGSGTTGVFTKHLAAASPEWKEKIGEGNTVQWPSGAFVGAKGNEGVTAQIQQTPGSIGYIEYGYAKTNKMKFAQLENKNKEFITASAETVSKTLASVTLPENLRSFIEDPEGPGVYPIASYSWILVPTKIADPTKAKAMEVLIEYGLNEGQDVSDELGYIPLPKSVRERVLAVADKFTPDYTMKLK